MAKRVLKNRVAELMVLKARNENLSHRLSNRQLAREIGLSPITVNQYVNNQVERYDRAVLEKLAEYFGCDINDLLFFAEVGDDASPESQSPLLPLLAR